MPSLVLASDPSLQAVPTDPTAESRWQVDEPHLQAKVTPKPCWAVSCSCPEPQVGSAGWGHSTHLVADHHVDACGALAVHPVDVLWRDAVQVGDRLDQLQGGQLLQEDGVVHWRAEDRSFYRTSICFQSSPPTNSPPNTLEPRTSPDGLWDLAILGAPLEATRPLRGPAPGEKMPNYVLYPCFSLSWGIRVKWRILGSTLDPKIPVSFGDGGWKGNSWLKPASFRDFQ